MIVSLGKIIPIMQFSIIEKLMATIKKMNMFGMNHV